MIIFAASLYRFFHQFYSPLAHLLFYFRIAGSGTAGGLITASLLGVPWVQATVACVLGNVLPIPVILLFVRKVLTWLGRTKTFGRVASHFERVALSRGGELIEKYPNRVMFGLFVFVAIPLPMTGAWTGSLIAAFLGLPARRSFPPPRHGSALRCLHHVVAGLRLPFSHGLSCIGSG
jgi:uncharacterized membrane protein